MITQAESPFYNPAVQRSVFSNQRPFFRRLHMYLFHSLVYPGGLWSFGFASKKFHPIQDLQPDPEIPLNFSARYYNPEIHKASFILPTFIKENLAGIIDEI